MPIEALHREPLRDLYRRLIEGHGHPDDIVGAIDKRGQLAGALYAMQAAALTEADLDDFITRLDAAQDEDPTQDPVEDTTRREIARVQLDTLVDEDERRKATHLQAKRGEVHLPSRPDLVGLLMGLSEHLAAESEPASFGAASRQIAELVRRTLLHSVPGAPVVVRALRDVANIPWPSAPGPAEPWVRWAMALEMLSNPRGFGAMEFPVDPVTRAQATRAKRLLLAMDSQDERYDMPDWPLDLPGDRIADLLDAHHRASIEWAELGIPESDQSHYLTHTRREEPGRPQPHVQIAPEETARRMAEKYGAFPLPMIYPIPPRERARISREIWTQGLPPVSDGHPGLAFYAAGGDPRVRWGAPPFPLGVLCSIALPEKAVLHLFSQDHPEHQDLFDEITRRASHMSRTGKEYREILRNALRSAGYAALAHHHLTKGYLHELVVMDPTPETVLVVRESVPSFMRGDRPLNASTRRRGVPAMTARRPPGQP